MDRRKKAGDLSMTRSSIALLQERFRQLQRVKQLREERALLGQSSEFERVRPTVYHCEPSRLLFQSEMMIPPSGLPPQGCLSFSPELQSKNVNDTPLLISLWPANRRSIVQASSAYSDADVDTSLHL